MQPQFRCAKFFPNAPDVVPADPTLDGSIPLRARQHCMPFTAASGWGYHAFPPMDFKVLWNGNQFFWKYGEMKGWLPLVTTCCVYLPGQVERHQQLSPAGAKDYYPMFLEAFPETGILQVWTGYIARTPPDWSLYIRSPINLPPSSFFEVLEGIVETDWWSGPLFAFLRFTKTDVPVRFRPATPLLQVIPIPRISHAPSPQGELRLEDGFRDWSEADWEAYRRTAETRNSGNPGDYSRFARKRPVAATCPVSGAARRQ